MTLWVNRIGSILAGRTTPSVSAFSVEIAGRVLMQFSQDQVILSHLRLPSPLIILRQARAYVGSQERAVEQDARQG